MSLGTAMTTGALAWAAVFAKWLAMRFAAGEDIARRAGGARLRIRGRAAVLAFGLALLLGAGAGVGA